MIESLRLRFLTALATGGAVTTAVLAACGGSLEPVPSGSSGSSTESGSSSGSAPAPSSTTAPPPTPVPTTTLPEPEVVCAPGKGQKACYTRAELEHQLTNPYRGGDVIDAGAMDAAVDAPFDDNGCLPKELVQDGCCNAASAGPVFDGAKCCYVHCTGACCGRPFVVAGAARVAPLRERADWGATTDAPADVALEAGLRERLAASWSRDAAMEHASVASFARFTLELLALGAPAELLLSAQEAGREEVEHARDCFAIASRLAGRPLGPGRLEVGAEPARPLADAVRAAVLEGCVGETLSALLAEARIARARDADVRSALRRIANDEARHAELAWRFVAWAVAEGGAPVREAALSAFEEAARRPPSGFDEGLEGVPPDTLRAYGLLDERAAAAVVTRALHDVVLPCADALREPAAA